ncbi:MAG: methyltransferase domain-containing protein [Verrucomicrobiae bacterium]
MNIDRKKSRLHAFLARSVILKQLYVRLMTLMFFIRGETRDSSKHWCRIVMNRETHRFVESLPRKSMEALEISGSYWKDAGFKNYRSVEYPAYDVCSSILPEKYDLIIAEQVFEHLLWPYRAGKNIHQMLNPSGYFLITTPFLLRVHLFPYDCTRWTETGIRCFLAECGFSPDKITTGSWGNRQCVRKNEKIWARYIPWLHSLRNEPEFPIVVWAIAQK